MSDLISRKAVIERFNRTRPISEGGDSTKERARYIQWMSDYNAIVNELPSAQPEWNNHTVACMLAELFDDDCACNYNGIDEWLPEKCEVIDACPNLAGVACWEQYLKHRAERKNDEADYRKE